MSSSSESDNKPSPVGGPHKPSAAIPFRTSPLVDLSNKIVFSPQSELVTKLQQTSLSGSNAIPISLAKSSADFTIDKSATSLTQKTVSWSVGSYPPSDSSVSSSEIERLCLADNQLINDENVMHVEPAPNLPDHFISLIKNVPNNVAISHLRRSKQSGLPLKRVSINDPLLGCLTGSSQKKLKGPLEIIKESACSPTQFDQCRQRTESAPVPYSMPCHVQENDVGVLITPTKKENDSQNFALVGEGSITPISIRARQKLPALRKLPISRSMVGLDTISRPVETTNFNNQGSADNESTVPPVPGSASPHKLSAHSFEFRAADEDTHLLTGDMSKRCLLACKLFDGVPLVDSDEIAKLLEGHYLSEVERAYIIDCRFPYEYDGGHIKGAVNFPHPFYENLKVAFFSKNCACFAEKNAAWIRSQATSTEKTGSRVIIIFHCEFSSHRAPNTYRWFRTEDRNAHTIANYPKLDYPEAYVLKGGYKAFVKYCHQSGKQHLCDPPGGYIKQVDSRYSEHLRKLQRRIKTMSDVESTFLLNGDSPLSTALSLTAVAVLSPPRGGGGDFFIGSPSRPNSLSCDDMTLSEPQLKARSDEECDEMPRNSPLKSDFDEFEDEMKVLHGKREMYRRRSDCPVRQNYGLYSALGRASFEELLPRASATENTDETC